MGRKDTIMKGPEAPGPFISGASSDDGMDFDSPMDADDVSRTGTHYTGFSESRTSAPGGSNKRPDYVDPVVAEKEQRAVFWARATVVVVLLIAVSVLASSMYMIVTNSEKDTFKAQFESHASEISTVVQETAKNTIDAVEAFSTTITSYAIASGSKWPLVMYPDFTSHSTRLAKLTKALGVNFCPIVQREDVTAWNSYSAVNLRPYYQEYVNFTDLQLPVESMIKMTVPFVAHVPNRDSLYAVVPAQGPGPFLVGWQSLGLMDLGVPVVNFDYLQETNINSTFQSVYTTNMPSLEFLTAYTFNEKGEPVSTFLRSQLMQPIFETIYNGKQSLNELKMVGAVLLAFQWERYFQNILSADVAGIVLVLSSSCSPDVFTFELNGPDVLPLGPGDLHDKQYDDMLFSTPFANFEVDPTTMVNSDRCLPELTMSIYPTKKFEESFYTTNAILFAGGVIAIFAFTTLIFAVYDMSVRRRQDKVMDRIIRQDKIVSNLFPAAIRDRMYANNAERKNPEGLELDDDLDSPEIFGAAPMAELYPNVTVIFADISGFTAWSSAREPPQVFSLLESIYNAFDRIAYRHSVFKIETVGDCYVACAGLPEARDDHALMVAKFARDALQKMGELTRKLEVSLGPDTAELELRVGIHTGQVTAGVLRGERSRFQLFGDTVNTASRMESTSSRSRIQISNTTAEALRLAGRSKWLSTRENKIEVKGKGQMQTFWLESKEESIQRAKLAKYKGVPKNSIEMAPLTEEVEEREEMEVVDVDDDGDNDGKLENMTKMQRLVEWNVEVLGFLLQQIVAARNVTSKRNGTVDSLGSEVARLEHKMRVDRDGYGTTVLDEFQEIITLPVISMEELELRPDAKLVELTPKCISQLRDFLTAVAEMYNPNSFHNFEHASHVTASVRKLLTRIVNANHNGSGAGLTDKAGHSYGITSDPLTQFAVVFSAVIHDADHPGVPNTQLVKENTRNAQIYKKSVAEQNSVDLVWDLLSSSDYEELRACIYSTPEELRRFRQLVVNTVMATDIVDKELQALRKDRWAAAFSETKSESTPQLDMNRKATIVIEHLIQASDVSHTMQHWHIYKKWNELFFFELYGAYKAGRAETDPSIGWYKGEIGFFDFYIIPLAKKLENCGCFGVSSHEYLSYAMANRDEWVREGESIVQKYLEKYNAAHA